MYYGHNQHITLSMTKVIIIGTREIRGDDPASLRAKGYLKAFKDLGANAEYCCIKKFHYHISPKKFEIYYDGRIFGKADIIFVLSANSRFLLGYFELFRLLKLKARYIINSPESFLNGKNKFLTSVILKQAGVAVPQTWMVSGLSWRRIIGKLKFPVIIKKVTGSKGVGVMKFDSYNSLESFFDFYFSGNEDPQGLIIQDYIKESNATDFRLVVVNKKVIVTMMRKGQDPEKNFRSNLAQGAKQSAGRTDPVMSDLAIRATEAMGLFLSGVDIMKTKDGYKVLEVNSTPFIDNDRIERQVAGRNIFKTIAGECLSLMEKPVS